MSNRREQGKIKSFINTYSGLPKDIYILFIARVINCMGNFVYPFLTFFLKDKLQMSPKKIGFFITIAAVVGGIGCLVGGKISDKLGRKKVIILCQSIAAIALILCGITNNPHFVVGLLIVSGFFNGAAQPANSAMIADLTNQKNRKSAFSLLYLGINIGYAVGPLIAGFLYKNYMRILFIGDGISTIISLLLVMGFVKDTMPTLSHDAVNLEESDERAEKGSTIAVLFSRPNLLLFTLISIIYSFIYAQAGYVIPLQIKELFLQNSSKLYGSLMTVNALTVVFFTTLITHFTKKYKSILNIALAGIFYALGFGMLAFVNVYFMFVISTIIWTIGEILSSTNSGVFIANHSPSSHRGRFNAIIPIISGAGYAIAPSIMGGFLEKFGFTVSWMIVMILSIISSFFMYMLYLKEK
ncbi:MDR family MFS transporter [Haloimpatiens sp. FM7315]|uniref:MDR family MFS transporter n=1 Tax=Haloimpatiens sp. FM7315 TaxID=3298609 RepID=UPI00370AEDA4